MKIYIFCFVNAELYQHINALLTIRSEMLPFSENNQNIKMFGVPPEHFAIGYVHNDDLPLGNIALQYVIQTIAGRFDGVFWWFPALAEDQEFFFLNSPKLSCDFKWLVTTLDDINNGLGMLLYTFWYCECRWPLRPQNVQTYAAIAVYIWVIYFGCKTNLQ